MARRKEPWSYTAGERPYQVTVYERVAGGPISVRIWDPTLRGGKGQMVRRSLKHNDREKAREYAGDQASKLVKGQAEIGAGRVTLTDIFAAYGQYRTASEVRERATGRLAVRGNVDPRSRWGP